jgi:DNA helicase II / ATP-dependent DNA helicase PcrA
MTTTASQQQAITSNSPAILNVAGAGSGKTFTIIERIDRLVREGTRPDAILCLTFTRKAAGELKERLAKKIGDAARRITAGTFHSISYRILMDWGERIGYRTTNGQALAIVPPDEAEAVFKSIADLYRWKGTKKTIDEARKALAHNEKWPEDPALERIIREYWSRLRECNALDYDQLLLEVHRLFRECPDALHHYRNRWEHVFIDEYQDTDHVQYNLHEALRPNFLYAVGDPDQAIYGWRGADLGIILNFEKAHDGAEVIRLEECFRCGRPIVEAANALIEHNISRFPKTLIPTIDEGEVHVCGIQFDANTLLTDIDGEMENGIKESEIAVIGRTHGVLDDLVRIFAELSPNLPVLKVGAKSNEIEKSDGWKQFHAAIRMAVNPGDSLAFITYAPFMFDLSNDAMAIIRKMATQEGVSLVEAFHRIHADNPIKILSQFVGAMAVSAIAEWWQRTVGLASAVLEYLKETAPTMTAVEWLEWLAGKDMHTELEGGKMAAITFLTAHAAKGLEWDVVYLVGFDQDEFPKKRSIREGHLEEERRLAYVAFTRARKRLVICHGEKPSQFIKEAGLS